MRSGRIAGRLQIQARVQEPRPALLFKLARNCWGRVRLARPGWGNPDFYARSIAKYGASAESLDSVLNALESARWRNLFAVAIMPISQMDPLALLVRGSEHWLIAAETTVFALTHKNSLDLVGACDRITYGKNGDNAIVHLFDGSTV